MSGVVKEWMCLVHGDFEGAEPICPEGCDTVERQFRTPVGFMSGRTSKIDATLDGLAKAHGLTDMRNRNGEPAASPRIAAANQRAARMQQFINDRYGNGWTDMAPGGSQNVKTGEIKGSGPGANAVVAQHGGHGGDTVSQLKKAEILTPRPVDRHVVKNTPDVSTVSPPA